jgi:uncharacterized protein (DUF1501 family)
MPSIARAQAASGKKLIIVTCNGAWDVTFHLDPKPTGLNVIDVPAGSIVQNGDLRYMNATACNGVVDAFFNAHGDVSSIVRGIAVRSISHDVCIRRMLTGSPADDAPDMGVITAAAHAPSLPSPYLTLGAVSFPGKLEGQSVRVGATNQLSLAHRYELLAPEIGAYFPSSEEQSVINDYLKARGEELKTARGQYGANATKANDYLSSIDRAQGLADNAQYLGNPFELSLTLDAQLTNALTMLEQNVAWAVNVSTGFVWDTHNPAQTAEGTYQGAQGMRNQNLWPALTALVEELKTRDGTAPGSKMIDETVVVVVSEMTRTPRYNGEGGKDHWPYTSALVLGAGVNAGKTFGETDDTLIGRQINLATGLADDNGVTMESANFVGGVLDLVGVDPLVHLPGFAPLTAIKA